MRRKKSSESCSDRRPTLSPESRRQDHLHVDRSAEQGARNRRRRRARCRREVPGRRDGSDRVGPGWARSARQAGRSDDRRRDARPSKRLRRRGDPLGARRCARRVDAAEGSPERLAIIGKARSAAVDAVALIVFVVLGVLTHDASLGALVRDLVCILGGWFAVALAVRLYSRAGWWRVVVTWLVGITLGVLVR